MKLPFGLQMAQKAFRKNIHRKKMTACYIEGNYIVIGSNSNKTHPIGERFGHRESRTHCEVSVLKHVKDASKGTLYVYRERRDGSLGNARCCEHCMKFIRSKNVKKVVYTTDLGFAKEKIA